MRRTLIQIDEATYRSLRERAFREERSMAAVVRELLAQGLQGSAGPPAPGKARQFASVAAGRSRQGRDAVSERHDDALQSAFKP